MKVYRFFLKESYNKMRDMEKEFNADFKFRYLNNEYDEVLIHYAWTTSKKMRNEFIKTRADCFIYDETDFPDEMYEKFKVEYKSSSLDYRELDHYDRDKKETSKVRVLCTHDEFVAIDEFLEETFSFIIENVCTSNPSILNDEYYASLDLLLYTMYHGLFWSENSFDEDNVDYNMSYGLTPGGNSIRDLMSSADQLNLFVATFFKLFK